MQAGDLHDRVQSLLNEGDVDGLVALYEPDARMLRDDGTVAEGQAAIRDIWAGLVALGGQISMTTRYAVETGDPTALAIDHIGSTAVPGLPGRSRRACSPS